jgi:hypothetical protein
MSGGARVQTPGFTDYLCPVSKLWSFFWLLKGASNVTQVFQAGIISIIATGDSEPD